MNDDLPVRDLNQIRLGCALKLRAVQVSDHFQAILGCLLGENWTTLRLVEMVITPDAPARSVRRRGSIQGVPRRSGGLAEERPRGR
jgi:hypothetical protein